MKHPQIEAIPALRYGRPNPVRGGLFIEADRTIEFLFVFQQGGGDVWAHFDTPNRRAAEEQKGRGEASARSTNRPPLTGFQPRSAAEPDFLIGV